ncbi:MAG: WG repeat-containing protein [Bacteroidota bacterium]
MVVIEPTPPDSYRDPREGRLASECSHSSPPERGQGWVRSKSIILSLLLILICLPLHAQTNCEDATQIIRLAERDLANRTYERAINRLLDARDICPAKKTQVNALIKKAFQQIEGEKRSAKQAQEEALAQQQRAEQATRKADSSLALANKVLNQLYFYDDKFGLTYKNAAPFPPAEFYRYGYINRRGETVIPFEFEEATAFSNEDGFARVTKFGNRYLLDTLGRTYRLAESLEEITPQTEALHLRGEQMEQLGPFLAEQAELPNLKVLLLYATEEEEPLAQLPAEIDKLSQLTYLDLHGNDQISLPPSIAKLTQMIFLNLSRCGLQRIPPQLASMTELGHLDLSVNEIERFDDIFGSLILLDDLDLSYNPNTAPLPASIWECRILEELRLVEENQ